MSTQILLRDENIINKTLLVSTVYLILFGLSANIHISKHQFSIPQTGYIKAVYAAQQNEKLSYIPIAPVEKISEREFWEQEIKKRFEGKRITSVVDGAKHISYVKYLRSGPARVNIIEIDQKINEKLQIKPELAANGLKQKARVSTIARRKNAIAAVNGTYFKPETGVPIGTLFIDKKLITGPIYQRVALGISKDGFMMDRVSFEGSVKSKNSTIKIDNINQPRLLSTYTLVYTPEWGVFTPATKKYGIQVVIKNNKVSKITTATTQIPKDGYVISGPASKLKTLKSGEEVKLETSINPNWANIDHIISGGPYLVKDGTVFVDAKEQKLLSIAGRNPRTAVGYTEDGRFIMVTIDGRENKSIGMTLYELAAFMKEIGCYNAMNLDGGGSSQMYINGKVVNNPSSKGGYAVSNALTLSLKD
ncbi:MAG: phosphodiester glycosidase family protein [Candidatus Gastranaerophilaceae bacterium]|jgi:exopolysaccharide biosynthesis protein